MRPDRAGRLLTEGEIALARSVFGEAIDYAPVRIIRRKWAFFQPRGTVMAPTGSIHFHPECTRYRADFAAGNLDDQGLFIHEMVHVWQHQKGIILPIARHPFCRYDYAIRPGLPLHRYGIEQQAEIVRHAFLMRQGAQVIGAPDLARYEEILPFGGA
ncbi:MAG: vgr related protein [Sphingomonas bacterium]|uniref:vgr related protein n=1 Tax=Sphingomonas bacterium TaxID=1895847 RepID=UPI00262D603E|nr:vgr related protein [Sphingomonas bacterium]MDB5704874.1 vgr related protein [Sphingomonas bacterium]